MALIIIIMFVLSASVNVWLMVRLTRERDALLEVDEGPPQTICEIEGAHFGKRTALPDGRVWYDCERCSYAGAVEEWQLD